MEIAYTIYNYFEAYMRKLFYSKLFSILIISLAYSMEEPLQQAENEEEESYQTKHFDSCWYLAMHEAVEAYNNAHHTVYTCQDIAHVKQTGLLWPAKDQWAYDGYYTGQYVDINQIDKHREKYVSWSDEIKKRTQKNVHRFWKRSPKITIDVSRANAGRIKIEIDTTKYDQDLLNRRPFYEKPIPVLCLAVPTTIGVTWLFKSWWDSRK